jgi:hypothetical protein
MVNRRATRLAFAGLLLMLAVACQGGGAWSGPKLTAGKPNPSMGGFPAVSPARHALLGSMFLCLTEPGQAVITRSTTGRASMAGSNTESTSKCIGAGHSR